MIKIAAVSYINTLPFIYGILNSGYLSRKEFVLERKIPSLCSKAFLNKESDIVLVPSGSINNIDEAEIITNYGIASFKHVKSVVLASDRPLQEVNKILLDYQSVTSVKLLEVLIKQFWKINISFVAGSEGYEERIIGETAGLIIGDRAMEYSSNFKYVYDLSYNWWEFTGLPFVFAFWAKTKPIDLDFLHRFNLAIKWGVERKLESLVFEKSLKYDLYREYLSKNICFELNEKQIEGLKQFYSYMNV